MCTIQSLDFSVCVDDININHKTKPEDLIKYQNCTVLEGSLQINSALYDYQKVEKNTNNIYVYMYILYIYGMLTLI